MIPSPQLLETLPRPKPSQPVDHMPLETVVWSQLCKIWFVAQGSVSPRSHTTPDPPRGEFSGCIRSVAIVENRHRSVDRATVA